MKKKVLAGILAATMVFSLAACGSTGSDSDSGSSAASGSTAKTEEEGEPYTVTMVLQGTTQPDEERIEEKINEILEPELNAKLDIVVLPWASASQQLKLMLSGDEKIDLLYTSASTAVQYMQSGQIMDMSELIDKYGTNLKDIYGEDIAKTNQVGGFVYGVPGQIERGSIPAIFMRKDLVEKYNINTDEIKEPKDMEKVFEIVQAGEPDMTMLFSCNGGDTPMGRLFRGDGLGDTNTGVLMDQTNIVYALLSAENGLVNNSILPLFHMDPIQWYQKPKYWPAILIIANCWKGVGYGCLIYIASLIGIDPSFYEAARLDGASKWQEITKITLLLLSIGRIFYSDFGLFYQVPMNSGVLVSTTNVIDTYVYRALIEQGNISMSSAGGVYQSLVGFCVVMLSNWIVRKVDKDQALF